MKLAVEGTTRIHVRFKGGRTETLTTENPKSSAQQVKTQQTVIELVDQLLDDRVYPRSPTSSTKRQFGRAVRPAATRPTPASRTCGWPTSPISTGSAHAMIGCPTGMLTNAEITARLGICESTVKRWVRQGLIARHAYSGQAYLYEPPGSNLPPKQCSRWNRLVDRAAAIGRTTGSRCSLTSEGVAV